MKRLLHTGDGQMCDVIIDRAAHAGNARGSGRKNPENRIIE